MTASATLENYTTLTDVTKFDDGTITEFDSKVFSGLNNHVRLALRELGLKKVGGKDGPVTFEIRIGKEFDGV